METNMSSGGLAGSQLYYQFEPPQENNMENELKNSYEFEVSNILQTFCPPVLVVIGTVGNIAVLLLLYCRRYRMAVADSCIRWYLMFILLLDTLALLLTSGLDWIAYFSGAAPFYTLSDWTCKLYQFIFNVVIYAPDWLTFLSLIDRTVYHYYPHYKKCVCDIAKLLTVILLAGLASVCVHSMWTYEVLGQWGCAIYPGMGTFYTRIFPWISAAIYSYLPTLLNLCLSLPLTPHVCRRQPNRYTLAAFFMALATVLLTAPSIIANLLAYTGLSHDYTMMYLLGTIFQQLATLKRAITFLIAYLCVADRRARGETLVATDSIDVSEHMLSETTCTSP